MKIIGFSSGAVGRESNADRMVKAILDKCEGTSECVKLTDLTFSGCKGCVPLCAGPQVCMLEDDLLPYYQKVLEADRFLRHPKELAEIIVTGGTEYCGNCAKICQGSKEETTAMLKLHLDSGLADIPKDDSLLLNLTTANAKLEKYHVPEEDIRALLQG